MCVCVLLNRVIYISLGKANRPCKQLYYDKKEKVGTKVNL